MDACLTFIVADIISDPFYSFFFPNKTSNFAKEGDGTLKNMAAPSKILSTVRG